MRISQLSPVFPMSRALKLILIALSLAACSGGGGGSTSSNACDNSQFCPTPNVGQWVTFTAKSPQVNNNAFDFPCCDGKLIAGYFYTRLPAQPKVGQTLKLTYSLDVTNPIWATHDTGETPPPTLHLFIWQKGDNISCQGDYNFYRLFAARTLLVPGDNQTVSSLLSGTSWQGCYPKLPLTDNRLQTALNNNLGLGVTFGGQFFAGHGIYLTHGSARFTIKQFSSQ